MPCYQGEPDPVEPDLSAYNADPLRRAFRGALLNYVEPIDLNFSIPDLGAIVVQLDVVQETAVLATILRPDANRPEQARLLASVMLLSGFAEADEAAIDKALETHGFFDVPNVPPETWESARGGARPLMVNLLATPEDFADPHVRMLCNTLAETFFDLLGQSD
jgi:hypothetical protein